MAGVEFDVSELRQLSADLGTASSAATEQTRKVIQKAALNIKRDLQEEATETRHFPRVAASISYDTFAGPGGWVAEIGPEIGKPGTQGSLAWIAYEGTATTPPTFPDPSGALEREADAFREYLAEAVVDEFL